MGAAAYWNQLPVLVAYSIPGRDVCAGQIHQRRDASGAATHSWIVSARRIADRPAEAILEPDVLADESCMTSAAISDRDGLLNNAIARFTEQAPETSVYLDVLHPGWISAATMAGYLNSAGPGQGAHEARGQRREVFNVAQRPHRNANADLKRQYRQQQHQAVRHRH